MPAAQSRHGVTGRGIDLDPAVAVAIVRPHCPRRRKLSKPSSSGVNAVPPDHQLASASEHRSYLCLATAALAAIALLCLAGCQTPNAAGTVPPPGTGMIGQPAQYGSWATMPQGAAYPAGSSAPPMPGPATQWQGTAPAAPAAPPANTWSWSQPAAPTYAAQPAPTAPPLNPQVQQYANQMQAAPQQYANQMQQTLANQQQQLTNQAQATANQYQQGLNNQWQQMNNQLQNQTQQAFNGAQQQTQQYVNQGQQALTNAQQQVTAQMPQQPAPSTTWNPFATSASSMPPARATPLTTVPRY